MMATDRIEDALHRLARPGNVKPLSAEAFQIVRQVKVVKEVEVVKEVDRYHNWSLVWYCPASKAGLHNPNYRQPYDSNRYCRFLYDRGTESEKTRLPVWLDLKTLSQTLDELLQQVPEAFCACWGHKPFADRQ